MSEIPGLDVQIETLLSCKPLPEQQVKQLCERVSDSSKLRDPLSMLVER
jgi:hypothetical protein